MIDFIKFRLINANARWLENNTVLEFKTTVSTETGEISRFKNAYYKGLKFTIIEQTEKHPFSGVTVEGSLHKFYNKGKHNFNDFTAKNILVVLLELKEEFRIEPKNCIMRQLEIGVNIKHPYDTKFILNSCILHKTTPFKWVYVKDEGEYIQARHQRYMVKIYNKRKHYSMQGYDIKTEIMRFEIKYTRMDVWHKQNIYTLEDLLSDFGLNAVYTLFLEWKKVLFYDYVVFDGTKYEYIYSNPNFWKKLNYGQLRYHRNIINTKAENDPNSIKKRIENLILEKDRELNFLRDGVTRIL